MSEWIPQREAFRELAVQTGVEFPQDVRAALPLGYSVPEDRIMRWLTKLREVPKEFSSQRRFINRFKIGADPEFVFSHVRSRAAEPEFEEAANNDRHFQVPAVEYTLHQGLAFGADNNGRLVEIRPYPSRSAVAVCASILATMRWLAVYRPQTIQVNWECGAFLYGDGVGGHVHFGRKRPTREAEITALDRISDALLVAGVYPTREVERRRQGDARGQIYGRNHDFRLQVHGYEYRTFPSWLDSPQIAFLTMTLAKLAVYDPRLAMKLHITHDAGKLMAKLWNYLAYFKEVDDDARLACVMLSRRWPGHLGRDFKARWGLGGMNLYKRPVDVQLMPPAIKPSATDVSEMFEHLLLDRPLPARLPEPTWSPTKPPATMHMCIDGTQTVGMKGLGELIWDLCCAKGFDIRIAGASRDSHQNQITVSSTLAAQLDRAKKKAATLMRVQDISTAFMIQIPVGMREGVMARTTKDFLVSGLFPLWRVKDATEDSFKKWLSNVRGNPEGRKFAGKVLYP